MTKKKQIIFFFNLIFALFLPFGSAAQEFVNDFEVPATNGHWFNTYTVSDSTAYSGTHYCKCDSTIEYGLGFHIDLDESFSIDNLKLKFEALCRFKTEQKDGLLVISLNKEGKDVLWHSLPLTQLLADSGFWQPLSYSTLVPADYLKEAKLKIYIWNPNKNIICLDSVRVQLDIAPMPKYLPQIDSIPSISGLPNTIFENDYYKILYYTDNQQIIFADTAGEPLTRPIYNVCVYQENGKTDSITTLNFNWKHDRKNTLQFISNNGLCETTLSLVPKKDGTISFESRNSYIINSKILRHSIAIPFIDSTLLLYRKNQKCDSTDFQRAYYLDRGGFSVGEENRNIATYHQIGISSLQYDAENNIAYFNTEYWRDHPLIHYPLSDDTTDYYLDISAKNVDINTKTNATFTLSIGANIKELPLIMPIGDGYESAIIFTEHADWTDIRTHRAILFGNENIKNAENAVGGFVFFNIPVTKSVFYSNPDKVTNAQTSNGYFPMMHATIKTDKAFSRLLKDLKEEGFEICLHTPEQYSSNSKELAKALSFMKRNFGSPSWIDHGYNNGSIHNREDLVCDGLNPDSPQYAKRLWKRNGVKYLWNAYYEENRMDQWVFDGNLMQPYSGFGDALPNRQVTTHPEGNDFLLWATPNTLEVHSNEEWYYFYNPERLQRLVNNHDIHITHIYPAWTNTIKGFWEYDDRSNIVARPGFNFALQQIALLRDEHKMCPTTIANYIDFVEKLNQVEYQINSDGSVSLVNHGKKIEGLTLLCSKPINVEGKIIDFRACGDDFLVWFDLSYNEKVNIRFR